MEFYIIYGNHLEGLRPILDLAENIKSSLLNSGIAKDVIYSKSIVKNQVNIIIEEFSNKKFCNQIVEIKKKYQNTMFVLIITEIPINNSYNNFDGKQLCIRNYSINSFFDYKNFSIKIRCLINLFKIYSIISKIIPKFLKNIIKKLTLCNINIIDKYIDIYFYARFHNTRTLINKNIFEKIFIINNSSNKLMKYAFGMNFEEFPYYLELGNFYKKSQLIFFSGTITDERRAIFSQIESYGIKINKNLDFNDQIRDALTRECYFSLHVSRYQSEQEFSSPTRTLQALKYRTLTLPLKEYKESNLEMQLNICSLNELLKMKKDLPLCTYLEIYYNDCIKRIEEKYSKINNENKNRLLAYFKKLPT